MADAMGALNTAETLATQNIAAANTARADITRRDADIEKSLTSMPTFTATPPKLDVQPFQAPEMADPMKAWGSPTSVLALIASFATRHPLTAALTSATAAINAVKANNASAYQTAFDSWKANTDFAFKRAEWENNQYHDALDLFKTNFDQGLQKIQSLATLNRDSATLAALQSGNISDLVGIQNARTTALRQAQEGYEKAATVGEQINEWNDWMKANPGASVDDRIKAHQRIFPSTASARLFSEYDANKALAAYNTLYKVNAYDPKGARTDAQGKPAPDFQTFLQDQWPTISSQGGGGSATPGAAPPKPNIDAQIATSPTPPPPERHDAGGGITPPYPASASNPDGTLPPKGALPVPAGHQNDPDGQTYNGGKYKKQGNFIVPTGR